jgi:hypothetical protein
MADPKLELDVVLRILDDTRAMIAAFKIQRWEVTKWAVTLNIALAAASVGFKRSHWIFCIFSLAVVGVGLALLVYYNRRLTKTRERLPPLHKYFRENVIDLKDRLGLEFGAPKPETWDHDELYWLSIIIFLSAFPAYLVWAVGT